MFDPSKLMEKTLHVAVVASLCLALTLSAGCGGDGPEDTPPDDTSNADNGPQDPLEIAVIPKGTAHPYWKAVQGGAAKAAEEMDVEITWNGPPSERARQRQIQIVQNFTASGVDGIVLAPLDSTALVRPVESAVNRGIPVVIIDSGLDTDAYSSFVSTDNHEGGSMGGEKLGDLMDGEGRALLMRYNPGSASTQNREKGFLEAIQDNYPDVELVSTDQYAGVTREEAVKTAQNLISNYPDIEGIFCPNESTTFGMMRVLQKRNKSKERIKFVGFDATEDLVEGMRDDYIDALVAQDPFTMGYQGVEMVCKAIRGEEVPKRVATRSVLVTPENLDDEEIQEIVNPPVAEYLD